MLLTERRFVLGQKAIAEWRGSEGVPNDDAR
jgi:hypothetical protein